MAYASLNVSSFFVIIPGFHQQIRHSVLRPIIFVINAQDFFKRLAAAISNVPVPAPGRLGIVKARPYRSYRDLLRMMLLHVAVKIIQIIYAVVAAVARPAVFAGLHPRVISVKRVGILGVHVLVDEQRRVLPGFCNLAYPVPVCVGILGKNKYHWTAVITQI